MSGGTKNLLDVQHQFLREWSRHPPAVTELRLPFRRSSLAALYD